MTELDDALERETRAAEDHAPAARLAARYGGGWGLLPLAGLPPFVADFCSRLNRSDGTPALAVRSEGLTLVTEQWMARGFFARRELTKESRVRYDHWQRDGIPARALRIEGVEHFWEFFSVDLEPWAPSDARDVGSYEHDLEWGLREAIVSYLTKHPR